MITVSHFNPSIIFTGKLEPTRLNSFTNLQSKVEVTNNIKPSGLSQNGVNNCGKRFYTTGPCDVSFFAPYKWAS
jgi:hypothetical protein